MARGYGAGPNVLKLVGFSNLEAGDTITLDQPTLQTRDARGRAKKPSVVVLGHDGQTFRIEVIFVPASGDQQVRTGLCRADRRREVAVYTKDGCHAIAKVGIDVNLGSGRCFENKSTSSEPPGHNAALSHLCV